jgi:hypothetical protein
VDLFAPSDLSSPSWTGSSLGRASRLQAAGDHATLVMDKGAQHGFIPASTEPVEPSGSAIAAQATAFLVRTLS